jgi:hypothetical protein
MVDFTDSPADAEFRTEVQEFLEETPFEEERPLYDELVYS